MGKRRKGKTRLLSPKSTVDGAVSTAADMVPDVAHVANASRRLDQQSGSARTQGLPSRTQTGIQRFGWIKSLKRVGVVLGIVGIPFGIIAKVEPLERGREVQIRDQQAELMVLGPESYPKPDERWTVKIQVFNKGKTTAYNTVGSIFVRMESADMDEPDPSFDFKGEYPTDIVKDSGMYKSQIFPGIFPDGTLGTPEQQLKNQNDILSAVRMQTAKVYISGAAKYTTEFGDRGYLEYCYRLQPSLQGIEHCKGQKNRAWVQSKGWFATLFSALPFSSKN